MHPITSTTLYTSPPAASSFLKPILFMLSLVYSISSSANPVYIFHPLNVPLASSKHLPQVVLKHNNTTSYHLPLPACRLLSSIPICPSAFLSFSFHQLYPTYHPHHRSFCSSQNSIFNKFF